MAEEPLASGATRWRQAEQAEQSVIPRGRAADEKTSLHGHERLRSLPNMVANTTSSHCYCTIYEYGTYHRGENTASASRLY